MTTEKRHNAGIDGLRFFAFLSVFLYHSGMLAVGSYGVLVFFVLSGFLIGGILMRQRETGQPLSTKLRIFYVRRSLRIFPLYYLALVLLYLWFDGRHTRGTYLSEITYLTNFYRFRHGVIGNSSHLWTLAIEEQFYLLAPLLLLTLKRSTLVRGIVTLWACNALLMFLLIAWHVTDLYLLSNFAFGVLCIGIAAVMMEADGAFLGVTPRKLAMIGGVCTIGIVIFGLPGLNRWVVNTEWQWYSVAVSLATAPLLIALWRGRAGFIGRLLSWQPFAYLGQISYGLYIYHAPVLALFTGHFRHHHLAVLASFGVTVLVAATSWHLFESPINNLKSRFARSDDADPLLTRGTVLTET